MLYMSGNYSFAVVHGFYACTYSYIEEDSQHDSSYPTYTCAHTLAYTHAHTTHTYTCTHTTQCTHTHTHTHTHRIQAVWRGYKVREWYAEHRRRVPPRNPALRKKYFEQKLSALTEQLVGTCSSKALGVQSLINKTDQNIAASRNISR